MDLDFVFLVQEYHYVCGRAIALVLLFFFIITNQVIMCMLLCSKAENLCISSHSLGRKPYRQEKGERWGSQVKKN